MTIEIRDVTYKYPDSDGNALNKVNFTIKAGSLVCIVGYNGAGKSTLINLMTRIVDPTSGTVLISKSPNDFFYSMNIDADKSDTKMALMLNSMSLKTFTPT